MRNRAVKNLLGFLLTLVLTVAAVAVLSTLTAAKTDMSRITPALAGEPQAAVAAVQAAELSASIPQQKLPVGRCFLGFGVILLLAVSAWLVYLRSRVKSAQRNAGTSAARKSQRYRPREDLARKRPVGAHFQV